MNVLIVHAHPEPWSFSSALCSVAAEHLRTAGHVVKVSDLYAKQFNPVASAADFGQRKDPDYLVYAMEQRHAHETGTLAEDIQKELAKLLWCDLLILNFPLYWCATPAMLKGWIDRVMVSGVTYGGKRFYDQGGLVGKKAMLMVSLGGQAHMFAPDGVHGPLDDMLKPLQQGTLAYTGMTVLPGFVAWHVPYISPSEREEMLQACRMHLDQLGSLCPLAFPKLADFDSQLRPIRPTSSIGAKRDQASTSPSA
jgi:NAD(P)H dehydrogenase (quinone)